jgi:hypothetical protein
LNTRSREAGNFASFAAGRIGRRSNSPPQFGQRPFRTPSAQERQKVPSNNQERTSFTNSLENYRRFCLQTRQQSRAARKPYFVHLRQSALALGCAGRLQMKDAAERKDKREGHWDTTEINRGHPTPSAAAKKSAIIRP